MGRKKKRRGYYDPIVGYVEKGSIYDQFNTNLSFPEPPSFEPPTSISGGRKSKRKSSSQGRGYGDISGLGLNSGGDDLPSIRLSEMSPMGQVMFLIIMGAVLLWVFAPDTFKMVVYAILGLIVLAILAAIAWVVYALKKGRSINPLDDGKSDSNAVTKVEITDGNSPQSTPTPTPEPEEDDSFLDDVVKTIEELPTMKTRDEGEAQNILYGALKQKYPQVIKEYGEGTSIVDFKIDDIGIEVKHGFNQSSRHRLMGQIEDYLTHSNYASLIVVIFNNSGNQGQLLYQWIEQKDYPVTIIVKG